MTPEHRRIAAYVAACLKSAKTFTHIHDHDADRLVAVGGAVRPDILDIIEGADGARFTGKPEAVLDNATGKHIQVALDGDGFGGYDYATESHFKGVFGKQGAVQLYDHQTGRWHDYHVS